MENITIYTTPTCVYCRMTKGFLDKNEVAYTAKDVASDEGARNEMVAKSGQMAVPVIDIDGTIIVGFDKETIAKLAGIGSG